MTEFTDEQVGKRVVAQSGVELGTVADVRSGDIYVEVTVGDNQDELDELGWGGVVNAEVHRLQDRYVSSVEEDAIRLRV